MLERPERSLRIAQHTCEKSQPCRACQRLTGASAPGDRPEAADPEPRGARIGPDEAQQRIVSIRNESPPEEPDEDPDEDLEEPLEAAYGEARGARGPADPDPRVRWIYTPDLSSRTGWEAYLIRPAAPERRPAGFRPVRVRGDRRRGDPG